MSNCEEIITDYFSSTYFLFFPNICNAKCKFCYLHPKYLKKAWLSSSLLSSIENILASMQHLGFQEVRLTGGEPLVYENYDEVISILQKLKIGYSIITNGINLSLFREAFFSFPPKRLIVSFHSIDCKEEAHEAGTNCKDVMNEIALLARRGFDILVSIVFRESNMHEIPSIVKQYTAIGIRTFKLIYPNTPYHGKCLIDQFQDCKTILRRSFSDVRIFATRFNADSCLLTSEGFLSISVADCKVTSCCVLMGCGPFAPLEYWDTEKAAATIERIHSEACIKRVGFPCKTYFENCPLALEDIFTGCDVSTDYSD